MFSKTLETSLSKGFEYSLPPEEVGYGSFAQLEHYLKDNVEGYHLSGSETYQLICDMGLLHYFRNYYYEFEEC